MENTIYQTLEQLIQIQSDTNSILEKDIEDYLVKSISQIPYFNQHPTFGIEMIDNDDLERGVVWGLVKGNGPDTIVLLNHHDAVDIDVYGNLKSSAFDPEALRKGLKTLTLDEETTQDLEDDHWMFGRGTADMKAGIAIHLHILKKFSDQLNPSGNILFISVPDEEYLSQGMRHCSGFLNQMKDKHDLNYKLLINSEPHERSQDKFTIYDSSVGKCMASIFVQGIKSHIGKIYDGLNPMLLLSNIVQSTELNPIFSDQALGDCSPPPSWSFVRDFKGSYDASIPEAAGGYLSFLTLTSTPKDILDSLRELCQTSMDAMVEHKIKTYETIYNKPYDKILHKPQVKFYEELLKDAININKEASEKALADVKDYIKNEIRGNRLTIPESNFKIIKVLLDIVSYQEPTAVIALSPPYYPQITATLDHKEMLDKIHHVFRHEDIDYEHYFMGISDLSYTGLQDADKIMPYVAPNMPLWDRDFYTIDFMSLKELSIPSIILGPWGKDLHKMTERVYIPDLVEKTHLLIGKLIDEII